MFAMTPAFSFLVPSSQSRYPHRKDARLFTGDSPECVERPEVPDDLTPAECLVALLGRGQAIDVCQVLVAEWVLTIEARRNHPCSHDQFCDAFLLPEGFEICYRRDSQDRRMLVHPDGRILLTSDFSDVSRNRRRKMLKELRGAPSGQSAISEDRNIVLWADAYTDEFGAAIPAQGIGYVNGRPARVVNDEVRYLEDGAAVAMGPVPVRWFTTDDGILYDGDGRVPGWEK